MDIGDRCLQSGAAHQKICVSAREGLSYGRPQSFTSCRTLIYHAVRSHIMSGVVSFANPVLGRFAMSSTSLSVHHYNTSLIFISHHHSGHSSTIRALVRYLSLEDKFS
ncbi:hypothetical protein NL676_023052 [Syzygium grande]|nr:hypothetical protein NL676_023052 [Syzygium grande]